MPALGTFHQAQHGPRHGTCSALPGLTCGPKALAQGSRGGGSSGSRNGYLLAKSDHTQVEKIVWKPTRPPLR